MEKILGILIGWLSSVFVNLRRVKVTVHKARFLKTDIWAYFINATNLSKERNIEITHIWFDCKPQIHISQPDRPLPKRLKPDETWETWILLKDLPEYVHKKPFNLARVRLSTGKIIKSIENKNVPPIGNVPGGPIRQL